MSHTIAAGARQRFVYHQSVNAAVGDAAVADIAAAIGDTSRARMLYCLADGRARTSTELALVAGVTPSTASVHLQRLKERRLVKLLAQGKHRYYSLDGPHVADVLESLSVLAGGSRSTFVPTTPIRLRTARTCYDHIAGALGVAIHDRLRSLGWLSMAARDNEYELSRSGERGFESLGIDVDAVRALRRRFAFACVDWSERRPHVGGALGAALLTLALRKRWVSQDLDSRALSTTAAGRRDLSVRLGVQL